MWACQGSIKKTHWMVARSFIQCSAGKKKKNFSMSLASSSCFWLPRATSFLWQLTIQFKDDITWTINCCWVSELQQLLALQKELLDLGDQMGLFSSPAVYFQFKARISLSFQTLRWVSKVLGCQVRQLSNSCLPDIVSLQIELCFKNITLLIS